MTIRNRPDKTDHELVDEFVNAAKKIVELSNDGDDFDASLASINREKMHEIIEELGNLQVYQTIERFHKEKMDGKTREYVIDFFFEQLLRMGALHSSFLKGDRSRSGLEEKLQKQFDDLREFNDALYKLFTIFESNMNIVIKPIERSMQTITAWFERSWFRRIFSRPHLPDYTFVMKSCGWVDEDGNPINQRMHQAKYHANDEKKEKPFVRKEDMNISGDVKVEPIQKN